MEELAESGERRVGGFGHGVEGLDGAQGVLVGGIAVEKLVLDEAVERAELGHVAAEHADPVHLAQGAADLARRREDGLEGGARGLAVAERLVDQPVVGGDEILEFGGEAQVAELGVLEDADQAVRVLLEDFPVAAGSSGRPPCKSRRIPRWRAVCGRGRK